ncbi:MAG TPA: lipoyl(octanoyl) transferase LipB [Propionibacteriaceae bacterium]|nr:lipoyl(octanoyl) transferase LipB [Propionibacteriaceae bacterium]
MTSLPSSGPELSPAMPAGGGDLEFVRLGFDETPPRLVDYQWAWDEQRRIHAEVADGTRPGTVLLLEHADVYTAGRRTEPAERPQDGTPVVDVDRGGKITWHGPGQLVGYPIVTLPSGIYVVDYVRRLEEALIRTVSEYGLPAIRVQGRSGVWLPASRGRPERKVVAIGIRVSRKTTQHGFALNVDPDLAAFDRIIPCGITDAGVTSLAAELGDAPDMAEVADVAERHLRDVLSFSG